MLFPIIKEIGDTKALCPEAPKALHGISQRPALLLLKPEQDFLHFNFPNIDGAEKRYNPHLWREGLTGLESYSHRS